jgi:hypothetical protein
VLFSLQDALERVARRPGRLRELAFVVDLGQKGGRRDARGRVR